MPHSHTQVDTRQLTQLYHVTFGVIHNGEQIFHWHRMSVYEIHSIVFKLYGAFLSRMFSPDCLSPCEHVSGAHTLANVYSMAHRERWTE